MKLQIKIILLLLLFLFSIDVAMAAEESPIKGFVKERKAKGDSLQLSWTNAEKESYYATLIVGSDEKITWTPDDGEAYPVGEEVTDGVFVITKQTDVEFTTEVMTDRKYKYYSAFAFDEDFNYSLGRSSSQKIDLAIQITLVGMFVVFLGLILLVLSINALGKLIEASSKKHSELKERRQKLKQLKQEKVQQPHPQSFQKIPKTKTKPTQGIPPEVVAVISAAVAAHMSGKKFNIRSIKRRDSDPWGLIGIQEAMTQQ